MGEWQKQAKGGEKHNYAPGDEHGDTACANCGEDSTTDEDGYCNDCGHSYSKEASVNYSTDDGSDIVRQFQANMGNTALGAGAGGGGGRFDDFSSAAQGFLRTAGRNYSMAEQSELIREGDKGGARNLGSLDLTGTHYEDMDSLGW